MKDTCHDRFPPSTTELIVGLYLDTAMNITCSSWITALLSLCYKLVKLVLADLKTTLFHRLIAQKNLSKLYFAVYWFYSFAYANSMGSQTAISSARKSKSNSVKLDSRVFLRFCWNHVFYFFTACVWIFFLNRIRFMAATLFLQSNFSKF